ncbi:hypothetical protein ACFOLF_15040 [Paenibacillus sepulcri]|uniref:DUF5668 domain-containing protein n=1 Tax=Paenibacillus sepulcri TaxID=359917 RepID=A0ABS7C1M0_9BACL|nr:hypothetical protein [Paenibacillus sepulcri]
MSKKAPLGALLVLVGIFLFTSRDNVMGPGKVMAYFWPSLFVIPLGLLFHWMYFYATERRGIGLLIPGGILFGAGIVCQISMLFDGWAYMWPGFPLAVAFGLFEFYWFGKRNRWMLVPVFILGSASIIFFVAFTLGTIFSFHFIGQTTAAVALVVAGVLLMLKKKSDDNSTY